MSQLTEEWAEKLNAYREYLQKPTIHAQASNVVYLNVEDLAKDIAFFKTDLHNQDAGSMTLSILNHAAEQAMQTCMTVRLVDESLVTPFREMKAAVIGRWVSVEGTVVKAASPRPLVSQAPFKCGRCGNVVTAKFKDGAFKAPNKCPTAACPGRPFILNRQDAHYRPWQRIRLQEIGAADGEEGRIPRYLDVDLMDELVEIACPGQMVRISGIVKVDGDEEFHKQKSAISYSLVLDANYACRIDDNTFLQPDEPVHALHALSRDKDVFSKLTAALCPSIYGQSMVKAGLLLSLLGGSRDRARRPDIHLLMIGDPGLGKSELLNAVCRVATRSVYVCANTATAAGLTATIQQQEGGEHGLEAGALVLADQGVCCIDELDKASGDYKVLLDVMEQQQVNLAKAGIVCSLPARASVIAAANPVGGHYNQRKSVAENIKMDSALLSRFDLLFVLLDRADVQLDRYLSDRVMRNFGASFKTINALNADIENSQDCDNAGDEVIQLARKLKSSNSSMTSNLLKQYIAYARAHVNPKLSEEARLMIKEYYLEMRKKKDSLPVTTRQLEALIRLTEARAKAELRALATVSDALDAIALLKYSLHELHQANAINSKSTATGKPMGRSGQMKKFVSELIQVSSKTGESSFTESQLQQLHQTLQSTVPFREMLETLNHQGYMIRKGQLYKLLVT